MNYIYKYKTPKEFSDLFLLSDGENLTGLFFEDGKNTKDNCLVFKFLKIPVFDEAIRWLDIYFSGKDPGFVPKYKIEIGSDFKKIVFDYLLTIPFGESTTYGEIAKYVESKMGNKMAPQAIGRVVALNPMSLIIPCHRVIGKNGSLTGYNGCMKNKAQLMLLENIEKGKESALDYLEYQKHKIYKD